MYPLLPWGWVGAALTALVFLAVGIDDFGGLIGYTVPDNLVVRYLPIVALAAFGIIFGGTSYFAIWRWVWWAMPFLHKKFYPDVNGIYVGRIHSNYPLKNRMLEAAFAAKKIDEATLQATELQEVAVAVELRADFFRLKILVASSATGGTSRTVIAKPWRDPGSDRVHLSNIYLQTVTTPAASDEGMHFGAADLEVDPGNRQTIGGVYWTRRRWQVGLNTAGTIKLKWQRESLEKGKTLLDYAMEEQERIEAGA
ncbi:MAG: hypothetical protein ACFCVA_10325 [Gammaproteobacteria bacterium]